MLGLPAENPENPAPGVRGPSSGIGLLAAPVASWPYKENKVSYHLASWSYKENKVLINSRRGPMRKTKYSGITWLLHTTTFRCGHDTFDEQTQSKVHEITLDLDSDTSRLTKTFRREDECATVICRASSYKSSTREDVFTCLLLELTREKLSCVNTSHDFRCSQALGRRFETQTIARK